MSASKHSAGPWASNGEFGTLIIDANSVNVATTLNQINATKGQKPVPTDLDEVRANARLIAAAPDLYGQHEANLVDLDLLRQAIEAGDPKGELLIRVKDVVRRTTAALTKAQQP